MAAGQFLPLITGSAGALVVLALWVWAFFSGGVHSDAEFRKLEAENDQLTLAYGKLVESIQTERKTVNETAAAGQVTNQLITALAQIAAEKHPPRAGTKDLTVKDLGP